MQAAGKTMLVVLWNMNGVYFGIMHGKRCNYELYILLKFNTYKSEAICTKCKGLFSNGVYLQQDNFHTNIAEAMVDTMKNMTSEIISRGSYSPALAVTNLCEVQATEEEL
jgi:hypothetical protein